MISHAPTLEDAHARLKDIFGHSEFRGLQEPVIRDLLSRRNILLLMPTGMGKSLCYQLPARLFSESGIGITIVISPLIALMKDQVDALAKKNFKVCFINSSLEAGEKKSRYKKLAQGQYEIIYVTPERFRNSEFREALAQNKVALLAIDEAHCISSWGHDFRPDYSRIGEIREALGQPLTIALTATATPQVRADIISQLSLSDVILHDAGLERKNLAVKVVDVYGLDQKIQAFAAFRNDSPGACIIYFSLIETLEKFSNQLSRINIPHLLYHGQMPPKERVRVQNMFLSAASEKGSDLILATPAFGLGIDKENIRSIFHAEIPGSLEAYYQEIGRAGRDGQLSRCYLLFDQDDLSIQMDFVKWSHPDPGFVIALFNLLERNLSRVKAEGNDYLRTQLNFYNRRDFRVETALNQLERWESISSVNSREMKVLAPPPPEFLSEERHQTFLKNQHQKLLEMVQFAQSEAPCRMQTIKNYFGYVPGEACGICDICMKVKVL
jgi:ATP-dependent DNA helicase RecQ